MSGQYGSGFRTVFKCTKAELRQFRASFISFGWIGFRCSHCHRRVYVGVKHLGRQVGCHCAFVILRPGKEVNAELWSAWIEVRNRTNKAVRFKDHGQN